MSDQNGRWSVVADTINSCMDDLNMNQADLVRESTLSEPTIRGFMAGVPRSANPGKKTLRKLEDALLWPPGAVRRILAGEDPDRVIESTGGRAKPRNPAPPEDFVPMSVAVVGLAQLAELSQRVDQLWADFQAYQQSHRESREQGEAWMNDVVARLEKLEVKAARPSRRSKPASG